MKTNLYLLALLALFSCNNAEQKNSQEVSKEEDKTNAQYIQEGKEITQATFKELSENLQQAMAEGGVENALKFCNVNAMSLTDSLSTHFNVQIKRTSHKVRNVKNVPSDQEQQIIEQYLSKEAELKPIIQENEKGLVSFYAPIVTKGLCLTCHGEVGKNITKNDYQVIQSLYPKDKAVGFNIDELRGIWSITFNN